MDSSEENLESLSRNIDEYEKKARRRAWISTLVPLFFGLLLLGYTLWQIQVYGQQLADVQQQLSNTSNELGLAITNLQDTQEQLNQTDTDLDAIQAKLDQTTHDLEKTRAELDKTKAELEATTEELRKRSDFLAYSIEIDSSVIKELSFEYPYPSQVNLLNFVLTLQERRIPFTGDGFSEREGFNSPNFTVYVMESCGLITPGYGAESGPQSMLSVIDDPAELSIGDIVFDDLGSGYSMFYFELTDGQKFLIGMTPAGILAVTPDFILEPKYFDVPYELFSESQCRSDPPK